jgi:hypothetical protein
MQNGSGYTGEDAMTDINDGTNQDNIAEAPAEPTDG